MTSCVLSVRDLSVTARGLDEVDHLAFVIALQTQRLQPVRLGAHCAHGLDIGQRGGAVNIRLARAQQVEIGAIDNMEGLHPVFCLLSRLTYNCFWVNEISKSASFSTVSIRQRVFKGLRFGVRFCTLGTAMNDKPADTIEIIVNGEAQLFEASLSVAALLAKLGLPAKKIAVEHNLEIVPKSAYGAHMVDAGDRIEIVHFIGGG